MYNRVYTLYPYLPEGHVLLLPSPLDPPMGNQRKKQLNTPFRLVDVAQIHVYKRHMKSLFILIFSRILHLHWDIWGQSGRRRSPRLRFLDQHGPVGLLHGVLVPDVRSALGSADRLREERCRRDRGLAGGSAAGTLLDSSTHSLHRHREVPSK